MHLYSLVEDENVWTCPLAALLYRWLGKGGVPAPHDWLDGRLEERLE